MENGLTDQNMAGSLRLLELLMVNRNFFKAWPLELADEVVLFRLLVVGERRRIGCQEGGWVVLAGDLLPLIVVAVPKPGGVDQTHRAPPGTVDCVVAGLATKLISILLTFCTQTSV